MAAVPAILFFGLWTQIDSRNAGILASMLFMYVNGHSCVTTRGEGGMKVRSMGAMNRREALALGAGGAAAATLGAPLASAQQRVEIAIGTFAGANNDIVRNISVPAFAQSNPNVAVRLLNRPAAEQYPRLLVA